MNAQKVVLWKRQGDTPHPVKVTAIKPGEWPGIDDDGEQIFLNTHFKTEREAWECVISNALAHVSLTAHSVKNLRERLASMETECSSAAITLALARTEYQSYLSKAAV